jgi:hydroxymethylglutaryl-CoA lyase
MNEELQLVECPRDAMQGLHEFIPTETKAAYINQLLKCNFDTMDFGSFVSPKAIPQMRDTAEVLEALDLGISNTKLLAIVANKRGAEDALNFGEIECLGFPFSISETFQQRNTNSTIAESLARVDEIQSLCIKKKRKLVVYLSMAFGNPYGDVWNPEIAVHWTKELTWRGIETIALADTIGVSNPENIKQLFSTLIPEFPRVKIGAHLHTTPDTWKEKVEAAWNAGCRRFDSAVKGYGGCPMAEDKLTGNMPTENLLSFLAEKKIKTGVNATEFAKAMVMAGEVFPAS